MHKVSILIPLYNGIEFLQNCLDSIKRQTHEDWEIIIGVNGHDQNSDVFIQAKKHESDKIRVIHYQTRGKPNTMNAMVSDATHDIVCLLDVDDWWDPTKLADQLRFIDEYDVVGTHCYYIRNRRISGQPRIPVGEIKDFISCNPMISSSLMLHKADCRWNDVILDDYDLVLRLASENKRFYNVHKQLVYHRLHNQSAFNSKGNHRYVKETVENYKCMIENNRLDNGNEHRN